MRLCLRAKDRPTADAYIGLQWLGDVPEEIGEEDQETIALLRELETRPEPWTPIVLPEPKWNMQPLPKRPNT